MSFENLDLILLNIGYSQLHADWNWQNIYSPFARIYYVTEGMARTKIKDKVYTLEPNHLYLTPPFTLHDDECDNYFSLYYIHFYEKAINKESIFDKYNFPVDLAAIDLDLSLIERLQTINPNRHLTDIDPKHYDNPPTFSQNLANSINTPLHLQIETQGILYQLMSRYLEFRSLKLGNKDSRIDKSLKYIHENINDEISISQLADIACLTEDHFIKLFKKEVSYTPLQYILQKKIEKAQLLLITSNMQIREIAAELSIDNVSYFNRLFKKYTQMTPTEYKMQLIMVNN